MWVACSCVRVVYPLGLRSGSSGAVKVLYRYG